MMERTLVYHPTAWEDRVLDDNNGTVLVEGTPLDEENMNNIEEGILLGHNGGGLLSIMAMNVIAQLGFELDRYKKQKLLQGKATIVNAITDDGYFRSAEPFVLVNLTGWPQSNAPDYDVVVTPSGDASAAGTFIAYDKTQNGFKVKMTGSAKSAAFTWTLINPNIQ